MYPDVTTAMATETQDELVHRAATAHRARTVRARGHRRPHPTRVGGALRRWIEAGEL